MRFYIDTNIWVDWFEDRKGFHGEPLGEYAEKLLTKIRVEKNYIVVSSIIMDELQKKYSMAQINGMMKQFEECILFVEITQECTEHALHISHHRNIPFGDAIHAILCQKHRFILVTRDKHFYKTLDITPFYRPEEIN